MSRITIALVLACILLGAPASRLYADIVVVEGRYFTDRSSITGYFYSTGDKAGDQVVLVFGYGGVMGYQRKYLCSDKWGWEKIKSAASTPRLASFASLSRFGRVMRNVRQMSERT